MTKSNNDNDNEEIIDNEELKSDLSAAESENIPVNKNPKSSKSALVIALLALFLIVTLILSAGYFYKLNKTLTDQQQAKMAQLSSSLSSQEATLNQQNATLESALVQVNQQLRQVKNQNKLYSSDLQSLQRRMAETTVRHPNDWILAEVEYLIRLAGSKIWLESDLATAVALLSAADQRLLVLSDPSLNPLRSALLEDINSLESLPKRDPDGLILALSNLESRADKLLVVGLNLSTPDSKDKSEVSTDIKDWNENLSKSWRSFVESFVVINKRDVKVQALLSSEQKWYLQENLRAELAKAEFAVYREQQDIYDIAMQTASDLLTDYYDLTDNTTNYFFKSIQSLRDKKVSVDYPDQLKSATVLARIMTQRVNKSLANSTEE
ncbi:uroporphyrin-III C-methyltransferase HemX [Psychromonas ingrahamii 37]|uniref:Uroporphyrin-III C-methyltransferase HemX n=1 Tax=Psychromonas ingrahamii (strain DSM 17664 / CCUG 51855 / 37) TaxID=357804 RepID=A1T0Q8_PSYIN|nr:uroporphyrinogen-III C-methyltransferase [Psychromonas ingrahamii]ABM05323.1 uroporphyrin-III C-methyltransferase HemX [Psychromonas ingrahamii 37]